MFSKAFAIYDGYGVSFVYHISDPTSTPPLTSERDINRWEISQGCNGGVEEFSSQFL
jgi:hypothetical protein